MNDARRCEGASGLRGTSGDRPCGDERDDDELQSDQGAGRRADNDVEVFPSVEGGHERSTSFAPLTPRYCSSLTFSIQLTTLPSSASWMAMCVTALVGVAPCQCFSPGGHETTSPGWISSAGPPQLCTKPRPAVTMSVWPSGWVCQAARAPGSKVTLAPCTRPGALAWNSGSTRTFPVNDSFDPSLDDREPPLLISISFTPPPARLRPQGWRSRSRTGSARRRAACLRRRR